MKNLQNEEMKKLQKEEALKRMKLLKLHRNPINEFKKENKVNYSERGILYWIEDNLKEYIREWEKETGYLVYHVIKNYTEFGTLYSLLYVSTDTEEWIRDIQDIQDGYCFVYVYNTDDVCCSEFGSIGIRPYFGGVIRTA